MATNAEPQAILFQAKSPEELRTEIHDRYGEAVGRILERGGAEQQSIEEQQAQVKELHDAGLNGNAEALHNAYNTHLRQFDIKSNLDDKWYHKLGRGAKEVMMAPLRGVKWAFTNHPILSTIATTGLLGFLAYQYGIPLAQFTGAGGDERTGGVADTLRRLVDFTPGGDTPGTGQLPNVLPSYPPITPPDIPFPDR